MTFVRNKLKSVILKAVAAGEDPITAELPEGKERPSVTPVTSDTAATAVPRGKRIGYPGVAPGVRSPKEADTAFGDGVGAGLPLVDCGLPIRQVLDSTLLS